MRCAIPKAIQKEVLISSRRRCCLCVCLLDQKEPTKGQIAHLNGDPQDPRFDNLVWLCLNHHDDFDGRTSQSKGFTPEEVREYRDRLYAQNGIDFSRTPHPVGGVARTAELTTPPEISEYDLVDEASCAELPFMSEPWRFPLWQVANQPELFAFKASNRADGVCLIERIDLPDGRIVIAAIEIAGNPGCSITNSVEDLCLQVCKRFQILHDRLIWLEHYNYDESQEWDLVTFAETPPEGLFAGPKWTQMTAESWRNLGLKPRTTLTSSRGSYRSKLEKSFEWPAQAILSVD